MENTAVPKAERLNAEIEQVQIAASKLIRSLMAALRTLGSAAE